MAYLLDTNTLIQAKNEYYAFDLCPGFWEWIDQAHENGEVYSIEPVRNELLEGADELCEWAQSRPDGFFLPMDATSTARMPEVVQWVQAADYKEAAKRDFLSKADPLLIAYSLAHNYTLATHEVHIEGERKKVKIPTVSTALGVNCVRTFEMLRAQSASFVLSSR